MLLELTCLECGEKILNIDKSDHNENGYFCDLDCSEKFIVDKVQKTNLESILFIVDEFNWLYKI